MKIGHHLLMYVDNVNLAEKLTIFKLDKNITLEKKEMQKK